MNTIFYKVIFKGIKGDSSESYSLTFKNIIQEKPINIPSNFFSCFCPQVPCILRPSCKILFIVDLVRTHIYYYREANFIPHACIPNLL